MSGPGPRGERRPVRRAVGAAVLLAAALAAGCAGPGDAGDGGAGRDRAAVAEPVVTIGRVEGPEETIFGDVTSVAADGDGRIYVADRIGSLLRVYGADGRFLRQIGREGRGPGEYESPVDLAFGPEGRLYVRDANRVTVLAPAGRAGVADSVVATWPIPGLANLESRRARVDSAGRYHYPDYRFPREGAPRHFYLVYPGGPHRGDTVPVPPYATLGATRTAHYMISEGTGRMVEGLSHGPFAPVADWDLTPRGTVIGGDGTRQTLVETDAGGDTLAALPTGRTGRRPVPPGERADSADALETRIDTLPVPLSEVRRVPEAVRERELPDSLPAFRSVHVSAAGEIWVERWPPEGRSDERFFDVLGPDGEHRGSVVLPLPVVGDPPPHVTDDAVYGVVRGPETGVERVVKLTHDLDGDAGR